MPSRSSASALLLGALLLVSACREPGAAELDRGNEAAHQRRFEDAVEAFRAAARAQPSKARPRELEGHALLELQRPQEARAAYEAALKAEPSAALEAAVGLARLDAEEGKLTEALARLDEALQKKPDNLFALVTRATLLLRRGAEADLARALSDTERALVVDPRHAGVLYARGCALISEGRLADAGKTFDVLRSAHPALPLAFYGYARLASAQNDKVAALINLRQARERATQSWKPATVLADPAFKAWQADKEFRAVVGIP